MSYTPVDARPSAPESAGGATPPAELTTTPAHAGYVPVASRSSAPTQPTPSTPSPYFSAVDKEGNSFGFSDQLDTSGKPLFAYRAPGDVTTTTDKTRVATTFDPRMPKEMDSKTFYNERAVAGRAALKTAMGGTYSDELDHKIALELSGSNQKENLQIEPDVPGTKSTATDPLENSLAKSVASGKISLFDAQTQLASAKGMTPPFTGVHHSMMDTTLGHIGSYFNDPTTFGGILKNTVTGVPATAEDIGSKFFNSMLNKTATPVEAASGYVPVDARPDPQEPTLGAPENPPVPPPQAQGFYNSLINLTSKLGTAGETLKIALTTGKGLFDQFVNPSAQEKDIENQVTAHPADNFHKVIDYIPNLLEKGAMRFFEPLFQPVADDLAQSIASQDPYIQKLVNDGTIPMSSSAERFFKSGKNPETPGFEDIFPVLKKTNLQAIGDSVQAGLAIYMPQIFGESALGATTLPWRAAVQKGFQTGAISGTLFGTAQVLSSGSTDPKEIKDIYLNNIVGLSLLGAVTHGAVPAGTELFDKATKDIINKYNLPTSVYIPAEKIRDIFQTGTKMSPDEMSLVTSLGLTGEQYRTAIKEGLSIEVPAEKITRIVDKPYWEKIKNSFGFKPTSEIIQGGEKPTVSEKILNPERQLPGYRKEPGQTRAFGMSTERVEPVGFHDYKEPSIDLLTGEKESLPSSKQNGFGGSKVVGTGKMGEATVPIERGGKVTLPEQKPATLFDQPAAKAPVYAGEKDLSIRTLEKLAGRSTVSKKFIENLSNQPDLKQQEREVVRGALQDYPDGSQVPVQEFAQKVKAELLPLTVSKKMTNEAGNMRGGLSAQYESITLPSELRGPIENYHENIYESPIKTSAGEVHFQERKHPNYFGHTRVEDVPDNKTRRVIEVQSDLYQKGNLEKETQPLDKGAFSTISKQKNPATGQYDLPLDQRTKEVAKLQQYNDPTAHFRMVREEVKKAAEDGKTKLQFPTGETAMKIEGLGDIDRRLWKLPSETGTDSFSQMKSLTSEIMKVGMEVQHGAGPTNRFIITDVLGDGKFKAVPKDANGLFDKPVSGTTELAPGVYGDPSAKESFDISGKVDTNNPIYKFYEKDLGRYLKSKYGAETVTDKQGVTWNEVPVGKETGPVLAFEGKKKYSMVNEEVPHTTVGVTENLRPAFGQRGIGRHNNYTPQKYVDIRGTKAKTVEDIAAALKDYRNPRKEIFHVVYVKDGTVIAHTAFSSDLVDAAQVPKKEILYKINQRGERLHADGVYMAHNHPSGDITPSQADKSITDRFDTVVDHFKGHIVLDHDKFSEIQNNGKVTEHQIDLGKSYAATGQEVLGAEDAVALFKAQFPFEPNTVGVLVLNVALKPLTLKKVTMRDNLPQTIRQIVRETRGYQVILGGDEKVTEKIFDTVSKNPYIADVIERNKKGLVHPMPREMVNRRIAGGFGALEREIENKAVSHMFESKKQYDQNQTEQTPIEGEKSNSPKGEEPKTLFKNDARAQKIAQNEAELEKLRAKYENKKEVVNGSPLKGLERYVSKDGNLKGSLPELGVGKSAFAKRGDSIIDQVVPNANAEEVRTQFHDEYQPQKEELKSLKLELSQKEEEFKQQLKDAIAEAEKERVAKLDPEITHENGGVYPLPVRGGIVAPEVVWSAFKDKPALFLSRETMERNVEKIAPREEARKINDFLVEKIRQNELAKVKYTNKIRQETRAKMASLGIKRNTDEDSLIQVFGERRISLTELQQASPKKWKEIQSAADYFAKVYKKTLEDWNSFRSAYGYKPISPRADYFRHFTELNEWTKNFGFITNDSQLPTAISGKTNTFRPGKPFSTAEMHRTGDRTKFSAIGGLDNYLNSVSRQMFHIDSIQRGKALINYLEDVAEANPPGSPTPVNLPNFMANLREYTQLVAGKSSALDHGVQSLLGRPVLRFMSRFTDLIGRNIILGNVSAAISHSIPAVFNVATVDKVPYIKGLYDTLATPLSSGRSLTSVDGQESSFLMRRFPEHTIMPTNFQKSQETLGFVFKTVDEFISRQAVASKYYELLGKNMSPEKAMAEADRYAQRIIGDRSIGNLPNLMNTKSLGFLTQFQVEINDNLSVLTHDIPQWSDYKYDKKSGTWSKAPDRKAWRVMSMLVQFAIFSHLFNTLLKKMKGSGKGIDPIEWGLELAGLTDETKGTSFVDRTKTTGQEALGELPFSSVLPFSSNNFPAATIVHDLVAGTGTWQAKAVEGVANFNPLGGGAQAVKTYQGIKSFNQGYAETKNGKQTFKVDKNLPNALRAVLLGQSSFPEKGVYNSSINQLNAFGKSGSARNKAFQPTYDKIMGLVAAGKTDEATTMWNALSDQDKKTFSSLDKTAKSQATIASEREIFPKVQEAYDLVQAGKKDEAQKIWDGLDSNQKKAFTKVYTKMSSQ